MSSLSLARIMYGSSESSSDSMQRHSLRIQFTNSSVTASAASAPWINKLLSALLRIASKRD
jgi:hypothetical protein